MKYPCICFSDNTVLLKKFGIGEGLTRQPALLLLAALDTPLGLDQSERETLSDRTCACEPTAFQLLLARN